MSMKMAKPSGDDIQAAEELMQILQLIDARFGGPWANPDAGDSISELLQDGEKEFDGENITHLQTLYNNLARLLRCTPNFYGRVISGMCHVIMYPKNEILDPESDCIDLHPRFAQLAVEASRTAELEAENAALRAAQTEQHIQIAGQRLYEELRQWLATEHDPDSQAALQAWREAIAQTAPQHPDDEAVDRFAAAMKAKLAAARAKGRGGWENKELVGDDRLAEMLIEHLSKGNAGTFEDVANFAMMLHQRGADPKLLAEELVEAQRAQAALNTVIDYMLGAGRHEEPLEFLRCWNEGNFDSLREEWPEAPLAIYYADPLADHAAIDAALAKARQAEEGEAL